MKLASKYAYLKKQDNTAPLYAQFSAQQYYRSEVDTNVVGIGFDILKDVKNKLHQGDPIICKKCESVLNKYSKLIKQQEYLEFVQLEKKEQKTDMDNEETKTKTDINESVFVVLAKKNDQVFEILEGESIWICEFCSHINKVMVEKEEIPIIEDVVYMVQSCQQVQNDKQNLLSEQTVILCIDNSGSMSSTTEVKGKINLKHGLSKEEYETLKQFIEPGDEDQIFPGMQQKNITHVSRKQCVLAAIENQVSEMKLTNPNKVLGLVTFNNEVVIIGDGSQQSITIAGDRLQKAEEIRSISTQAASQLLTKTVKEASDALLQRFENIQEKGQTALGPAILAAVQLAKNGKAGSMVIVCTDGLANLGLGSMDGLNEASDQAQQFYGELALDAKNSGISISVVTIKGEGCRMDILGQLSETTNGNVTRVNPSDIGKDFANILKDEIVGTQVILIVKMHQALKFRNEEQNVSQDGQTLQRDIGNATVNTQVTFEYELKTDDELQKIGVDVTALKQVPFQARIEYKNLNGDKLLRVITKMVVTTEDLKKAEREAEVDVIHTRIQQQTAQHVRRGSYSRAQEYNGQWDNYVQHNEQINNNVGNQYQNQQFQQVNSRLNKVSYKQETRHQNQSLQSYDETYVQQQRDNNVEQQRNNYNQQQRNNNVEYQRNNNVEYQRNNYNQQVQQNPEFDEKDQPQGFFEKIFSKKKEIKRVVKTSGPSSGTKTDSIQTKKNSIKSTQEKERVISEESASDEDAEEAEIRQFEQAKFK